jgi:hypothetical protein
MRNTLVVASIVLVSANTSNCNLSGPVNQPQGDFRHSVSTFQCGPADGPATAVLLARDSIDGLQPTDPHVSVVILRAAAGLQGTSWMIGTSFDDAGALYFSGSGNPEQATAGTVRITRVVAQQRIEGSVSLRFPSRMVTEDFSAPWIEQLILCG